MTTGNDDVEYAEVEAKLERELAEVRAMRNGDDGPTEGRLVADERTGDDGVWELKTSGDREPYMFRLDGEDMYAAPVMPAGYLIDVMDRKAEAQAASDKREQVHVILDMLKSALYPESLERLRERMYDPEQPVEFEDVIVIFNHLSKVVYKRPTQQSSASPAAQSSTGATSTAGAWRGTSTTGNSQTTPE